MAEENRDNLGQGIPDGDPVTGRPSRRPRKQKPVRDCALTLLEYRDRTGQEMRRKLKEREYSPEEIEEAIAFLEEYHYLDDEGYARRYVRTYSEQKSIRRLRAELEQKGIACGHIENALKEAEIDEASQIAGWIRKKGYVPGEHLEQSQYRKLVSSLGRRGYSFDVIRRVMDGGETG